MKKTSNKKLLKPGNERTMENHDPYFRFMEVLLKQIVRVSHANGNER